MVNIDPHTKYVIYAGNTSLLFKSNDAHDLVRTASVVLSKVQDRSIENGLKINAYKTKAVFFELETLLSSWAQSNLSVLNHVLLS